MKTCPRCHLPEPVHIIPDGIWWNEEEKPVGIAYRCACGNNRTVEWKDATDDLKQAAREMERR